MNGQIFISYRRGDSLGSTGRIYDRLLDYFPKEQIFMDVDTIPPGEDFIDAIERAVSCCDVLLAVIGRDWLHMKDRFGRRMLENDADFVRTEIRAALQRNVKVIPILVEDAEVPNPEDLPEDIKALARKNAIELRHTGFHSDVDRLIKTVQKVVKEEEKAKLKAEQKRLRREQLHEQEKETSAWRQAVQENSLSSYATYLTSYPQGKCAEEANEKIKILQKNEEERKKEQAFTHYYQQGIEAFEHGLFSESLSYFHEASKLRPDNSECKTWIDNCQSELDRKHVEEQRKKEAEQKRKEEEAIIKKQQELQLRREQEKRVEEERIKAKALELEKQGDKLKKSKDFKAALALYEQALTLNPNSEHSLQASANCKAEIQKKEEQERAKALEERENKPALPPKKTLLSNHWLIVSICVVMIGLVSFLIFGTKNNAADNKNLTAQKTKAIITESNKKEGSNFLLQLKTRSGRL
jgi:tetratricopeptide (TPR) repeat protein